MKKLSLLIIIALAIITTGYAQNTSNAVEDLSLERQKLTKQIDSLRNRITEIDKLLSQTSPEDKLEAMIAKYGKNTGTFLAQGKVWESISCEMARDSWGEPQKINKSQVSGITTEKWIYSDTRYLYFENDRLVTWKK